MNYLQEFWMYSKGEISGKTPAWILLLQLVLVVLAFVLAFTGTLAILRWMLA